jgi:glycosyltransferase involved in cell wall biosynthesis
MGTICIIKGYKPLISETFIATHVQRLRGEKVVLYNYFPEYTFNGRTLRYFYGKRPLLNKSKRILPQFLYDRWITRHERTAQRTLDFMTGFFRDHNVDVILAEYGFNGADITPIARQLKIPLVVHFHGHDAHRATEVNPYRKRYEEMFAYADRLFSVSHLMTAKLKELGADESKIVYNPYGAREYFFEVQPDYRNTLLAVGRFADIKAPYLTLMAFRQVAERNPDASLVMIGDGPLLETCRSLTKLWNLESRITFKGALPHEQALRFFGQACAFVQHSVTTSYGDSEGMPNSILEAGAAGLPVVATRHAGIVNSVVEGKTGFLVEEHDINGMAARMCELLEDIDRCREMGNNARQHIRENYNLDRHIDCLQRVIDQARESKLSAA